MAEKYEYWSLEQKRLLFKFAKEFRDHRDRVDWNSYDSQVEGKTRQQCKSYYTNVLKHQITELREALSSQQKMMGEYIF